MNTNIKSLHYKAWKFHVAAITIAMIIGLVCGVIQLQEERSYSELWKYVLFAPVVIYVFGFSLWFASVAGLGFICFAVWKFVQLVYGDIVYFYKSTTSDRRFYWSDYFKTAALCILAIYLVCLSLFIILSGIKELPYFRNFFDTI